MNKEVCPVCGTPNISAQGSDALDAWMVYTCPTCGKYELYSFDMLCKFNQNHLAPYLFYNRFLSNPYKTEYRYHTAYEKDFCDICKKQFENGDIKNGRPVHMDNDLVDAWYPKTFSERVDYIIEYLGTHIEHAGQQISFSHFEILSLLFIDRVEKTKNIKNEIVKREKEECEKEIKYMLGSLANSGVIEYELGNEENANVLIRLTPKGYARVDELQKNTANGKAVLVAMKFGNETELLRNAIRDGIKKAGYNAVFIDEVQHNDFITPELLKHIRDSKFVVVDLTHRNNGAYFEEGYAMGLGKPVIQLCKQDTELHFDIAQKNTIIWRDENDIPEKLCNRILATID